MFVLANASAFLVGTPGGWPVFPVDILGGVGGLPALGAARGRRALGAGEQRATAAHLPSRPAERPTALRP